MAGLAVGTLTLLASVVALISDSPVLTEWLEGTKWLTEAALISGALVALSLSALTRLLRMRPRPQLNWVSHSLLVGALVVASCAALVLAAVPIADPDTITSLRNELDGQQEVAASLEAEKVALQDEVTSLQADVDRLERSGAQEGTGGQDPGSGPGDAPSTEQPESEAEAAARSTEPPVSDTADCKFGAVRATAGPAERDGDVVRIPLNIFNGDGEDVNVGSEVAIHSAERAYNQIEATDYEAKRHMRAETVHSTVVDVAVSADDPVSALTLNVPFGTGYSGVYPCAVELEGIVVPPQ